MKKVEMGRKMVIAIIVIALLIDIATIATVSSIYAVRGEMDIASFKLLQGIFRFILTCVLLFFIYKGYSWAKWICVVLFLMAGVFSLISLLSNFNLITLIMGLIYLPFGIILIASNSINLFFKYQRGEFISDSDGTMIE